MSLEEIAIISLAGFFSGLIKTGVGIGAGLFLLPTLALAFPAKMALGMGAPMMLVSDIMGLRFYWRQWLRWPVLSRLLFSALPGVVAGVFLLPLIPGQAFRLCVGVFGMCYALSKLWKNFPVGVVLRKLFVRDPRRQLPSRQRRDVYVYGFLGGLSTVLAHAGGLVWSIYLVTATWDRRVFVGTTIIMFFITNICKTISYIYIDILTFNTLFNILFSVPMILLGSFIGNKLNKKCNPEKFRNIVLYFIFATSFSLCI